MDRRAAQDEVLSNISKLVMMEQKHLLTRPIEMMELEEAVKQLKDNKAPGPDGILSKNRF